MKDGIVEEPEVVALRAELELVKARAEKVERENKDLRGINYGIGQNLVTRDKDIRRLERERAEALALRDWERIDYEHAQCRIAELLAVPNPGAGILAVVEAARKVRKFGGYVINEDTSEEELAINELVEAVSALDERNPKL